MIIIQMKSSSGKHLNQIEKMTLLQGNTIATQDKGQWKLKAWAIGSSKSNWGWRFKRIYCKNYVNLLLLKKQSKRLSRYPLQKRELNLISQLCPTTQQSKRPRKSHQENTFLVKWTKCQLSQIHTPYSTPQ